MKSRILSTARLSLPLATALAALLSVPSASALDGSWLGTSGNWTAAGTWSGGIIADGTGFTANFTGVDIAADQTITLTAPQTIGNITFTDATTSSNNLLITGANLLTLDVTSGAPAINVTQSDRTLSINSVIAGTVGLQKSGAGTLTLNGSAANSLTGGINVNGGTLTLDYANLAVPANLVDFTNALQINNGALTITGQNLAAATTAQIFANTSLGAGTNTLNIAKGVLATSATLNLGALTTTAGSVTTINPTTVWANNVPSTTEKVFITSVNGNLLPVSGKVNVNASLFYRQSANPGAARWVSMDSAGQLQGIPAVSIGILSAATAADPKNAYQISSANITLTNASMAIYGLVLNGNATPRILTLAANGTLTLNGILGVHGTNQTNIVPGTGTSNLIIGPEKNLVINLDNSAPLSISAPIVNNGGGASSVTIASTAPTGTTPGTVTFGGANTYTGATLINTGTLSLTGSLTGGGAVSTSGTGILSQSAAGVISGASTFTQGSSGTSVLAGTNTYTGATNINRGTLALGNATPLGTTPGVNGTSGISMAAGTTLRSDANTTVFAPITLSGTGNVTVSVGTNAAKTFNLNGGITGATGNIIFSSAATNNSAHVIALGAAGNYTGNTTLTAADNEGVLRFRNGIADALPNTTVLTFGTTVGSGSGRALTYDLNGNNQTLAGLSNGGTVPNARIMAVTSATAATLTINNTADYTYGGAVKFTYSGDEYTRAAQITGAISLTKSGAGTFTLDGTLTNGATAQGNTFTGTTRVLGGILVLGETLSIQNSTFNTQDSVVGDATNGLRTTVTALRIGGINGNKNFADVFTTTSGGYSGLTALTLNIAGTDVRTYSADLGDGAGGMNLIKIGAGTQILTAAQTCTGTITGSAGVLLATQAAALPGYNVPGKVVFSGGTIAVQVGVGGWTALEVEALVTNATKTSGFLGIDTTSGSLVQSASFTSATFGSTLGLNKLGSNDLTLDQANTYTSTTTVTAGTLTLTNPLALQNSPLVTTSAGTVSLGSGTVLNLGGLSGATGDLATVISNYSTVTAINLNTPATLPGAGLAYGGIISDGVLGTTLTKTGLGVQALSGANSYTGATQVNDGILVFRAKAAKTAATATAAAAGSIGLGVKAADAAFYSEGDVADLFNTNSLLGFILDPASGVAIDTNAGSFDQTIALTGTRSLTKLAGNTLTLSAANTYSGATIVNNGTLSIGSIANIGAASPIGAGDNTSAASNTASLVFNGGTLAFTGTTGTTDRGFTMTGNVTISFPAGNNNALTFSGNLTGAGTLTLNGASTVGLQNVLTLSGSNADFTGNVTATIGGIKITNSTGLGSGTKTITLTNGTNGNPNIQLDGSGGDITLPSTFTYAVSNSSNNGSIVNLAGNNTVAGQINNTSGGGAFKATSLGGNLTISANYTATTTARSVVLSGSSSGTVSGIISDGSTVNLPLQKTGGGTWTLTGVNTYSGTTTISAGTLALGATGSINNSASISIGAAGTLDTSAQALTAPVTAQPVTISIDPTGGGSSGKVVAAGLDITNAVVVLNPTATLDDDVYVLATYTSLNGASFAAPLPTVPLGYTLNYAYETNKIALVKNAGFSSWITGTGFLGGSVPVDKRGPNDDPDNDGIRNLVEYAVAGQDPTVGNATIGTFAGGTLSFDKRLPLATDITYAIEDSTDLGLIDTWAEVTNTPPNIYVNDGTTISYTLTPGTPPSNFIRLQVIQLP